VAAIVASVEQLLRDVIRDRGVPTQIGGAVSLTQGTGSEDGPRRPVDEDLRCPCRTGRFDTSHEAAAQPLCYGRVGA
jgi:hypothetical protein